MSQKPYFVTYINNNQIDTSPESIIYISPEDSPNGQDIVVTANEVSATVSLIQPTRDSDALIKVQDVFGKTTIAINYYIY